MRDQQQYAKITKHFAPNNLSEDWTTFSYNSTKNLLYSIFDQQIHQTQIPPILYLLKALSQNRYLSEIPKIILGHPHFKNYQSCQLLIHRRGEQKFRNFFFHDGQLEEIVNTVSIFNKIAATVTKSKYKRFDQGQLDLPGIEILGPFLANYQTKEQFSIITVISRNGFLPPSKEEEQHFYQFLSQIENYLFFLITAHNNQQMNELCSTIKPLLHKSSHQESSPHQIYHQERINLLGELLNTLKHELMNPLFGLNMGISLLDRPDLEEDTKLFIDEMLLSITRSQNIIDNFSSLYDDSKSVEMINFPQLLFEVLTLTKSETKQIPKEISIPENLQIKADKTSISQIIFNLIINASHAIRERYSDPSQGLIKITVKQDTHSTTITISDNGIGIPQSNINKVITPFFTTKKHGTGLGLTICKSLIEQQNGKLEIDLSQPDGATFHIILER